MFKRRVLGFLILRDEKISNQKNSPCIISTVGSFGFRWCNGNRILRTRNYEFPFGKSGELSVSYPPFDLDPNCNVLRVRRFAISWETVFTHVNAEVVTSFIKLIYGRKIPKNKPQISGIQVTQGRNGAEMQR